MRKIDKNTGEIHDFKIKGLWSHFPIPAYQVLSEQKAWAAQKLLTCLISFLGDDGFCVYPSYRTIAGRCGLSPNSIHQAIEVLKENGFVKVHYFKDGKKDRNKYYLQECCWDSGKMNSFASSYRKPTSKCLDCGKLMDRGGYGVSESLGKVHYGCGGQVVRLDFINQAKSA